MDKSLWTASLFLIITGLLSLAGSAACRFYQSYKEPGKERITARVVDLILREPKLGDGSRPYKNYYYPVFEYYAGGRLYKVVHPQGAYPSPYRINQEIKLCYRKDDPEEYEIAGNNTLLMAAGGLFAAGVICLFAGCIVFVMFALRSHRGAQ